MKKGKEPKIKLYDSPLMHMGERIKKVREILGYTQTEFADRIGLGFSSISKIETGINRPSPGTVRAICHEFGVNNEWLMYGIGDMMCTRLSDEELYILLRPHFGNARIEAALQLLNMPDDEFEAWKAAFNAFRFYTKKGGHE